MHKLLEYVCEELEALEKKSAKGSMSAAEIEYADKLANLKKNLLKGEELYAEMEQMSEYSGAMGGSYARGGRGGQSGNSNRGGSYRGGSYRGGSYAGGSYAGGSYEGGGGGSYEGSYEGGSYARGRGRGSNAKRDSMGRYSSESGYSRDSEEMVMELQEMVDDPKYSAVRNDIERLIRKVEQM